MGALVGADPDNDDHFAALMVLGDMADDLRWLRQGMVKVK